MGEYPAPWGVKLGKAQTGLWNIPRRSAAREIYYIYPKRHLKV